MVAPCGFLTRRVYLFKGQGPLPNHSRKSRARLVSLGNLRQISGMSPYSLFIAVIISQAAPHIKSGTAAKSSSSRSVPVQAVVP